jgi:outer membrane protein assembly factor BamB
MPLLALLTLTQSLFAAQGVYYAATNLWKAHIGWGSQSSPALGSNGDIYVGTWNGDLIAFKPDGAECWRFKTGFEIASSPAVGTDGTVYVGCRDRRLYAVDQHGRKRWTFKTGGWVDASAAIGADGTIYFGSWDKQFYALNPDGSKKWKFATGGPIVSSAAIDASGVVYFGSHDRKFYALNPDGTKRWEFATRGAITSSPAVGRDGEIYFTSVDGKFHALHPNGTPRWNLQTGGITRSSPVLAADGTIYVSVNQTHCAISPEGKLKWQRGFWHPQPGSFGESAAAVLGNGSVVFTGGDGYVMTVPSDDGAREWIWNFWLFSTYSSVVVGRAGDIYAMGLGRELYALRNSVPLAESPWPMFRADPQHTGRVRGR